MQGVPLSIKGTIRICFMLLIDAEGFLQVVMVNSSWTRDHIRSLWWNWHAPIRVYPPCDTDALQRLPLDRKLKRLYLVSVAQFRPEKNHLLQLQAFAMARAKATGLPAVHGETCA